MIVRKTKRKSVRKEREKQEKSGKQIQRGAAEDMQILKGAEVSSAIKERVQEQLAGLKAGIPVSYTHLRAHET